MAVFAAIGRQGRFPGSWPGSRAVLGLSPRRSGDDGKRRGWRAGCFAAGMPAVGVGLAVHLELLRLLLDVDGSGEPGVGVPLL